MRIAPSESALLREHACDVNVDCSPRLFTQYTTPLHPFPPSLRLHTLLNPSQLPSSPKPVPTVPPKSPPRRPQPAPADSRQITPRTIFSHLQSVAAANDIAPGAGKLDILVRTSDTKRLSDFMLWQADDGTQVHFVKTYWPDFGLSDLLPILLGWQQRAWVRGSRGARGGADGAELAGRAVE